MERPAFSEPENFEPSDGAKRTRNKDKNHKRFSDEQIKLLETIFESETRLEPKKKVQLAREIGLQPRQVAIWFQNRRARWKSKQIEQDFRALKTEYDCLASKLESLEEEKQSLLSQLKKLNDLLREAREANDPRSEFENQSSREEPGYSRDNGAEERGLNEGVLVNTSQEVDPSLESWYRLDQQGNSVFDQPRGFSQWLNFWS